MPKKPKPRKIFRLKRFGVPMGNRRGRGLRGLSTPQAPQTKSQRRNTARYRRSKNGWYVLNELVLYKSEPTYHDIHYMTLAGAPVDIDFVPGYKGSADYRAGRWDGKAYFIRFETIQDLSNFKYKIWSSFYA